MDSAAIELGVFNDLIFDLSLLRCSCFMRYAVLHGAASQSSWPHYEVDQITNVDKSASLVYSRAVNSSSAIGRASCSG